MKRFSQGLPDNFELSEEFQRAFELMENSNDYIFITGKAGSGKSTLLQYFKEHTKKNVVVLAPTGIAAVNVGGQTIHSFFKFPPRFIQKENIRRRRNTGIFKKIDAIIIDEVSMVRADLLDGIDYTLRVNKDEMETPFGGVQIIFFGDLFQLPPVVEREMSDVLNTKYESPYFFSADVFNDIKLKYFELSKIYRQSGIEFVGLLDNIRNKRCQENDLAILNQQVIKGAVNLANCIILTTTNNGANLINEDRLTRLTGKEYRYSANASGKFDEFSYPTEPCLKLKNGAQIMLIKNDSGKRWVNGTLAEVYNLADDCIKVIIDEKIYDVPRVKWEKIVYKYNKEKDKIEEKVMGTFEQYPVKLAWAITIHKSQGQTFDDVIIDLEYGAFAHGQVYVALSRCTRLEGIRLKRPIIYNDIIFDERIYGFREKFRSAEIGYASNL